MGRCTKRRPTHLIMRERKSCQQSAPYAANTLILLILFSSQSCNGQGQPTQLQCDERRATWHRKTSANSSPATASPRPTSFIGALITPGCSKLMYGRLMTSGPTSLSCSGSGLLANFVGRHAAFGDGRPHQSYQACRDSRGRRRPSAALTAGGEPPDGLSVKRV
jgi:hypothetical protein